jgi:CheY-like chemotaxis protein
MTEAVPKLQVLVVDDSPVYRKTIERTLEDGGYAPRFAKSGREAMDLYAQHAPAL